MEEEEKSRGLWKLARVRSLITGRDGHMRGAVLHVPSSGGNGTLQRPLQHLYPLEVASHQMQQEPRRGNRAGTRGIAQRTPEESVSEEEPESVGPESVSEEPESMGPESVSEEGLTRARPRRAAAVDARDRLAACAIIETDP